VKLLKLAILISFALGTLGVHQLAGQQAKPQPSQSPSPSPSPTPADADQESVRVFTEEVRLPVFALDAYGHYDPTVEPDDVLVLEDGVIQQVRSLRHLPANVLFFLDTGGELSGLGGMSKSTYLTREVAVNLINRLPEGSWLAVVQANANAEVIQPWTKDKAGALKVLKNKLNATKRSRFSEAIVAASQQLKDRPEGTRHVVMITDGVDSPGGKTSRTEAVLRRDKKQMLQIQSECQTRHFHPVPHVRRCMASVSDSIQRCANSERHTKPKLKRVSRSSRTWPRKLVGT
jgi:von Willebrand factor type A domain